ncbi:MAG: GNAT family N-acetyltransferase [Candidatus Thorarchaeota archaeon SMTZ1-83]|nr:MAG: hypothetical protein AM324_03635 [Candidatus Thorarchaeota archaeon SMTZ1-83]
MEVIEYEEKHRERWEEFVERSNNGTIFHRMKFLDYHPKGRFQNRHFLIEERDRIVSVFPGAEEAAPEGRMLVSHPGASYGGFVVSEDLGVRGSIAVVKRLFNSLRERGFKKVVLTQPPVIYQKILTNYIDFAVWICGGTYLRRELSAVIEVSEDPLLTFRTAARTAVRKSIKSGVKVRESQDYERFYEILRKNLRMRHNVTPTHSLDELLRLTELFPERIRLFCAYLGEEPIGGIVSFICNQRVVLAFYISHIEEYQSYRPVNLLIYELLKWLRQSGHRYLDLGTFTLKMEPDFGLARFKENFKARGLFRDTLVIEL